MWKELLWDASIVVTSMLPLKHYTIGDLVALVKMPFSTRDAGIHTTNAATSSNSMIHLKQITPTIGMVNLFDHTKTSSIKVWNLTRQKKLIVSLLTVTPSMSAIMGNPHRSSIGAIAQCPKILGFKSTICYSYSHYDWGVSYMYVVTSYGTLESNHNNLGVPCGIWFEASGVTRYSYLLGGGKCTTFLYCLMCTPLNQTTFEIQDHVIIATLNHPPLVDTKFMWLNVWSYNVLWSLLS